MKNDAATITFKVKRLHVDKRIDNALSDILAEQKEADFIPSRVHLTKAVKAGLILVNGHTVKSHYSVSLGDVIEVSGELLVKNVRVFGRDTDIRLVPLYENEHFLILDKPAGLLVHPAGTSEEETIAHFLVATRPEIAIVGDDARRPGIVHRLDRETSGVLLIAKNQTSFLELQNEFEKRRVKKVYLALVYGHLDNLKGKIDTPLTRSSGDMKRSLAHSESTGKTWSALTKYEVVRRYADYDLLSVTPKTGRTHQIRVHFSGIGHPVVGDKLYAYRAQRQNKKEALLFPERHMLHASELTFDFQGQRYSFEAQVPADFQAVLRDIDPALTSRDVIPEK